MNQPITILYPYPVTNTPSAKYDPAKPLKYWARPLAPGEDAGDDYVYSYVSMDGKTHQNVISKGDAANTNIPGAIIANQFAQTNPNQVPVPVDLTKIPAGGKIVASPMAAFGGQPTVVTDDPIVSAPGATQLDRILQGVNALLHAAGLPPV